MARRRVDGGVALLGRNVQDIFEIENTLLRALALALAPTIVAILAIGAFFARRASLRLAHLHEAIANIMQGQLQSRLPAAADGDEIDRIAHSVNLMLDEIERLLDQLKSVGDNIAHDLRAPLTLARIKLDRALESAPEGASAYIEAAQTQLDRAAVTIAALLRISAVENGPREKHFRDVDLAAICAQAVEFYEPVAEAKSISLTASLEGPLWIRGDEELLREAIANLVDNAVKFTGPGGTAQVVAAQVDGRPCCRSARHRTGRRSRRPRSHLPPLLPRGGGRRLGRARARPQHRAHHRRAARVRIAGRGQRARRPVRDARGREGVAGERAAIKRRIA